MAPSILARTVRLDWRAVHQCNWDLWCSLECTPACQAGGRGFKSRQVRGRIAQLVERAPEKCEVAGSTPAPTTSTKTSGPLEAHVLSQVEVQLLQAATDLRGPEATVAAKRADGRDLAGPGPTSDGLRVDPEERGNLRRGQKSVSLLLLDHVGYLLSVRNLPQTYESGYIGAMAWLASLKQTNYLVRTV